MELGSQSKNSKQDGEAASVLGWTQHHFFHLLLVKQTQSLLRFKGRGQRLPFVDGGSRLEPAVLESWKAGSRQRWQSVEVRA